MTGNNGKRQETARQVRTGKDRNQEETTGNDRKGQYMTGNDRKQQ